MGISARAHPPEDPPVAEAQAAPAEPAPECSIAEDCTAKGKPRKGMQWACNEGACGEVKLTRKTAAKKQ